MKVAIIHDHFLYFGGAERVLLAFLKMHPTSDVFVAFVGSKNRNILKRYTSGKIITPPFDAWPFAHSRPDIYKPLLYIWWESIDLSQYDLIISSSHSFSSKSVIASPRSLHISYIHTPPRYLWGEYSETRWIQKPVMKYILSPLFTWLRYKDKMGATRPDILVANSKNVQTRIHKYYGRDSYVVYPPVEIPQKLPKRNPRYFLCVSRLVKQKGIELAICACNELKEALVIVGTGAQEKYLRSIAGSTIQFLGFVPDKDMTSVYAGAKALLYPSIEEDFGLSPVEAMAHGVPVIGFKSGGVKETIIEGKTGIFFKERTKRSLVDAIKRFQNKKISALDCRNQARKFSKIRFNKEIHQLVSTHE